MKAFDPDKMFALGEMSFAVPDFTDDNLTMQDISEDNVNLKDHAQANALDDRREVNFWLCLVFQSHDQKQEFIDKMKIETRHGMYCDGLSLAESVGCKLEPVKFRAVKAKTDARLVSRTGIK